MSNPSLSSSALLLIAVGGTAACGGDPAIISRFNPPTILSEGADIKVSSRRSDPTLNVDCQSGDLHLLRHTDLDTQGAKQMSRDVAGICRSSGIVISEAMYEDLLPALFSCVRKYLPHENDRTHPIEIVHMGIHNDRNVSGSSSKSLHSFARAIDIKGVRHGELYYDYEKDFRQDNGRLKEFWYQLEPCLESTDRLAVLDGRYNSAHEDHIHVSVPFSPRVAGVSNGERSDHEHTQIDR